MNRFFLVATLAGLMGGAHATTIAPMSVERLTETSSHVVVAHASKSWAGWNAQHTMIVTYTEFAVDSWLKGTGKTVITVKQPGGSADGYTQHVAGVRPWSAGESAVLFLHSSADGGFVVSGLMQGNFRLRYSASGETIADNGIASSGSEVSDDIHSYSPTSKSLTRYNGNRMSLDQLERRVRTAIQVQ